MTAVTLPGGLWLHGERHAEANLRPITGEDEAFLIDETRGLPPVRKATLLLSRVVESIGPVSSVTPHVARSLSVGDREAILLHLRRATLGDRLPCVLQCPEAACGEKMDLNLRVGDFLLPPYPRWEPEYEEEIVQGGPAVRFRLPTGGDLEAVEPFARLDPAAAGQLLLRRCAGDAPLPPGVAEALPARMAELDPQAEILLDVSCPACGHAFQALLDVAQHLLRELAGAPGRLDREVHVLAFHYHWSPRDILALTPRKRRVFLDLLQDALGEGGMS